MDESTGDASVLLPGVPPREVGLRTVFETEDVVVFDDVLDPTSLERVMTYVEAEEYSFVNSSRWFKIYAPTDGNPLRGPNVLAGDFPTGLQGVKYYPTGTGIDAIVDTVMRLARDERCPILDRSANWAYLTARACLYSRGDALGWHNDRPGCLAQWIFYVHRHWSPSWGGELLLIPRANSRGDRSRSTRSILGSVEASSHVDSSDAHGCEVGLFIPPSFNRLVIVASGVAHKINRVDSAAGDNVRASITGFFLRGQT